MQIRYVCRCLGLGILGIVFTLLPCSPSPSWADGKPKVVHLEKIGDPTWKPIDFHLFAAPIGTADSGYAEFLQTTLSILPPPNHVFHPQLGVGPGAPHQPPYDSEIDDGVENQGYRESNRFRDGEFSSGSGVFLAWMNVPHHGTTGSSPDFASGPIISNSLFPIHASGVAYHNDEVFDPYLVPDVDVPPLDGNLDPPFDVDGHSHFPFFTATTADFGPPGGKLKGSYVYKIDMTDTQGNGWHIEAHFSVAK